MTHFHPDHIGLAGWLTEHWQAPLWITEKEWLHARMMSRDGTDDSARLRRDFAHRAGLDDEAATVFAERQGVTAAAFRRCRLPTTGSARARSSRSAGATGA